MPPWPKEHGAYGQVAFPLVAAFAVAGVSAGGLLLATATIAGFLAHEPALVALGLRGPRARRERGREAALWLASCGVAGAVASVAALLAMPPPARWSVAVPLVPATLLALATLRGAEKTWYGETAAALAFSGVAVPVSMATGRSATDSLAVAVPFALLFVSSTLAVRVVILRVRGGGNAEAVGATRQAALWLAAGSTVLLALAARFYVLPGSVLAAAAPGLLVATAIALRPPAPTRLHALGWTLVAISVLTTVIVVASAAAM